MRILIVSSNFPPNIIGGAEVVANMQAQSMKSLGHEVVVFSGDHTCTRNNLDLHKEHYQNVWVWRVPIGPDFTSSEGNNFNHQKIHEIFNDCIDDFEPDVVHFHNLPGLSVGLIGVAKQRNLPVVVTVHDHWGYCHRQTLMKSDGSLCFNNRDCSDCLPDYLCGDNGEGVDFRNAFVAEQLSKVDAIVSPSAYLLDKYIMSTVVSNVLHKLVISNGVSLNNFSPSRFVYDTEKKRGSIIFGSASYLGEHKGVKVLLNALLGLKDKPGWRFKIAGKGHLEDFIRDFIANNDLSDKVELIGSVENSKMPQFYQEIDVYVLPSIWPENQPCTILESKASGVPTIASGLGGSVELITSGIDGFLFSPGSSSDLQIKMSHYINNPGDIFRHGISAFNFASNDSLYVSVRKYINLYELIIA